jgi:hypothetical protein
VTQDKVYSQDKKENSSEVKTYDIPKSTSAVIDPKLINQYIENMSHYLWLPMFLSFVLFGYCYRLLQIFIYALIGKVFAKVGKVSLTYGEIMQIAMVAITPALVVGTIFDFFEIIFIHEWLFYFLLSMFYLFYGIIVNKN